MKPELCSWCAAGQPKCFCDFFPISCHERLTLFLAGFEAARQESFRAGFDSAVDLVDPDTVATIPCPPGTL